MWLRQGPAWSDQATGSCPLCAQERVPPGGAHEEELPPILTWTNPHLEGSHLEEASPVPAWRCPCLSSPGGVLPEGVPFSRSPHLFYPGGVPAWRNPHLGGVPIWTNLHLEGSLPGGMVPRILSLSSNCCCMDPLAGLSLVF